MVIRLVFSGQALEVYIMSLVPGIARLIFFKTAVAALGMWLPIQVLANYEHMRYAPAPIDTLRVYSSFAVSFDSSDDNDGDGFSDAWRIAEWVIYEVRRYEGKCLPASDPTLMAWETDAELADIGIAPRVNSYLFDELWRETHPQGYQLGTFMPPFIAARLASKGEREAYNVLNAVPQRARFRRGIWLELEYLTAAWAQRYGKVWVITGPVVLDRDPSASLGEDGEMAVAIPDALFKIVVREGKNGKRPEALGFIYPQFSPRYFGRAPYPHQDYLVSINTIEGLTGLNFFPNLPATIQNEIERHEPEWLWPVKNDDFVRQCR